MNQERLHHFVTNIWQQSIIPELSEFIKIPCKSVDYDKNWEENGLLMKAAEHMMQWAKQHNIPGIEIDLLQDKGRTPLLYIEIPGEIDATTVLYGHLDKMPENTGWSDGLEPWKPVLRDGKLYGRGSADDGYSFYASLAAILALRDQGLPHPRCVLLIEGAEESGSIDFPYYLEKLADRIGEPELVVCLDSGCGNYDQLWCTSSLRGVAAVTLEISSVTQGLHSGDAGGIVPATFRMLRILLDRIENMHTGEILLDSANVEIPGVRQEQAKAMADVLGDELYKSFPFVPGCKAVSDDNTELLLNRTWRPALVVTGADYLPEICDAGNVLRAKTKVKLSMRLPPKADPSAVVADMKRVLEQDPPYNAKIVVNKADTIQGWDAPETAPWLEEALHESSNVYFGKDPIYMGEGGSIGFIQLLNDKFPKAQFLITGVLGPHSNAHGPNEFLHLDAAQKLTSCVAHVLNAQNK
ncbi:MAG: M20/M25/M40 family metallo-hydrolase [Gammaproteobacteria bacterium]|nr:M20/M25/M40 family metallo-hydrolase [Gammaproteobacteria bacterium]